MSGTLQTLGALGQPSHGKCEVCPAVAEVAGHFVESNTGAHSMGVWAGDVGYCDGSRLCLQEDSAHDDPQASCSRRACEALPSWACFAAGNAGHSRAKEANQSHCRERRQKCSRRPRESLISAANDCIGVAGEHTDPSQPTIAPKEIPWNQRGACFASCRLPISFRNQLVN